MGKAFHVRTFGCQMNVHDSQRISEVLSAAGYVETEDPERADVIVLNTCSVREKAEHKLRSTAGALRRAKERGAAVVAAGCVAKQEGNRLLASMRALDVVVGPDNIAELPALLRDVETGAPPIVRTVFDLDAPRFLEARPPPGLAEVSAYVTTMKGCDERCSFCVVPYTRGPERYRPSRDIVSEVAMLVANGTREVTLLGQTVNSYRDPSAALAPLAPGADPDESQFPELVRTVARDVPSLARLRYTSPHPRHLTPALIRVHAELAVLAHHLHLPVQSGSDRVLKRMVRRYTRAEYVDRIEALRRVRPAMSLTTDVIVGFPGETRADFEETLALVREVGFAQCFGFKFSRRPRTPALRLRDDVPEAEKSARLTELFELQESLTRAHLAAMVGTRQAVLVEGPSPAIDHAIAPAGTVQLTGRTGRHEIVHLAVADPRASELTGCVVELSIARANKHSLVGVLDGCAFPPGSADRPARRARRSLPLVGA